MSEYYRPLTLPHVHVYPAYQLRADLCYDKHDVSFCMRYVILTVIEWLRKRVGQPIPTELDLPAPEKSASVEDERIVSYHMSTGFTLDITALMNQGIYAVRLKEPDIDRPGRNAVLGRFFLTEIGLKLEADHVALGIRIDVIDPDTAQNEIDYAYRPAFLRRLFENKSLRLRQTDLLSYDRAVSIGSYATLNRLVSLAGAEDNLMPTIVMTYAVEQRSVTEIVTRLDECLGLKGTDDSFTARLRELTLVPDTLELGEPVLPYDADDTAAHAFGYARVYTLSPRFFEAFRKKMEPGLKPGDILVIEPKRFGGMKRLIQYSSASGTPEREACRKELLLHMHRYSKNKSYDFDGIVFETSARRLELELRLQANALLQRNDDYAEAEKQKDALILETEELMNLYEQDKINAESERDKAKSDLYNLQQKYDILEARLGKSKGSGIVIEVPDESEFYDDEFRDLILSVIREAVGNYRPDGSRAKDILSRIAGMNDLTGEGSALFDEIRSILFGIKNVNASDLNSLKALGFKIERHGDLHYKLTFRDDPRYTFTLPSTGSDVRGMKNCCAEIIRRLSVYK